MDLIEVVEDAPGALLCCDVERARKVRERFASETHLSEGLAAFRALANPTRLRLSAALLELDELCVCDASWICDISVALASHHLKALLDAGIVERRKEGKLAIYQLSPRGARTLTAILKEAA